MAVFFSGLLVLSLCLGLMGAPWWTLFAGPSASCVLAIVYVSREHPTWDANKIGWFWIAFRHSRLPTAFSFGP